MSFGDLALPVGHVPVIAPAAPALRVEVGRRFRQPLALPDSASFSPGLEIWVHTDDPDRRIFAMFDGLLRFVRAAAADRPHSLQLNLWDLALKDMRGLLEPAPRRVIYENVDEAIVKSALHDLIFNAFAGGASHPVLSQQWKGDRLRLKLAAANAAGTLESEINEVVDAVTGPGLLPLRVLAGDYIGAAAAPLATDPVPPDLAFAGSARRLTLLTEEYAENRLSPSYYIWRFFKNANAVAAADRIVQVKTRAPLRPDNTFDHPLLDALGMNLDITVLPRVITRARMPGQAEGESSDVLLFPIGPLGDWHGMPVGVAHSMIDWRITNDPSLEFQTRLTADLVPAALEGVAIDATNQPDQDALMASVWADHSAALNHICVELQFPSELIAATVGAESRNNPRALRLEPLRAPELAALANAHIPPTIVHAYTLLRGRPVPDPWPGAVAIDPAAVDAAAPLALTWDQLLDIVDVVPWRMSPGLMQTLIRSSPDHYDRTAEDMYRWLQEWYPDVPGTFGVVDPFAHGPPAGRDWFFWLLNPRHSILVGTAHHKRSYVRETSGMDLPLVAARYNSATSDFALPFGMGIFVDQNHPERLNDSDWTAPAGWVPLGWPHPVWPAPGWPYPAGATAAQQRAIDHKQFVPNVWRLPYYNLSYPRGVSRNFNAIETQFADGAIATARFWQSS